VDRLAMDIKFLHPDPCLEQAEEVANQFTEIDSTVVIMRDGKGGERERERERERHSHIRNIKEGEFVSIRLELRIEH
jgi:hypothetical protein